MCSMYVRVSAMLLSKSLKSVFTGACARISSRSETSSCTHSGRGLSESHQPNDKTASGSQDVVQSGTRELERDINSIRSDVQNYKELFEDSQREVAVLRERILHLEKTIAFVTVERNEGSAEDEELSVVQITDVERDCIEFVPGNKARDDNEKKLLMESIRMANQNNLALIELRDIANQFNSRCLVEFSPLFGPDFINANPAVRFHYWESQSFDSFYKALQEELTVPHSPAANHMALIETKFPGFKEALDMSYNWISRR